MLRLLTTGVWKGNGIRFCLICAAYVLIAGFGNATAIADWRIDGPKYLQSAHGDMTCLDCHEAVESLDRHPDPANINKQAGDFFEPETCLACHDDVQEQIKADAQHGGEAVHETRRLFNCIECHDPHYAGAPEQVTDGEGLAFSEDDASCLACHLTGSESDPNRVERNRDFCLACHGTGNDMPQSVPVMDRSQLARTSHAALDCMTCHPGADRYGHADQQTADCRQCHAAHEESVAHDAHLDVACQACHLAQVVPVRDGSSGRVAWQRAFFPGTVSELHNFAKPEGQGCARCHFDGNQIGAATMILPAKSVICMPCHPATLTLKDSTSIIAFAVCLAGLLGFMTLWFSGTLAGARGASVAGNAFKSLGGALATLFSSKGVPIVKAVWYDAILQRRLYRRSAQRWAFHALIFWPFVIRFVWGVLALFATNWLKDWPLAWALINKNHPAAAFIFDFTGLCLGLGLVLALWRGSAADQTRTAGLPKQDGVALGLLLGIVAVGFILEGMRIAMTGAQGGAAWAFIGNGLSALFSGMSDLSRVYGFFWYAHAVLTGAFVAYLPFSRMMHIIMSPVVIAVNAGTEEDHR